MSLTSTSTRSPGITLTVTRFAFVLSVARTFRPSSSLTR